jgi:hypothetical protein
VSDLEPEITGKDFLIQLLKVFQEIPRFARNDRHHEDKELVSAAADRQCIYDDTTAAALTAPDFANNVIPRFAQQSEESLTLLAAL